MASPTMSRGLEYMKKLIFRNVPNVRRDYSSTKLESHW